MRDSQLTNQDSNSAVKGSRSTALKPIIWMTAILAPTTVVAVFLQIFLGVPKWTSIFFCAATGLSVLLYIVAYLYFMFTDHDALRSEKYVVEKLPTERGALGDIHIQFQPDQEMLLPGKTANKLLPEYQAQQPLTITERKTAQPEE